MCADLVRVHYQPEGGSRMMYTVHGQYNSNQCYLAQSPWQEEVKTDPSASGGNVQGSTVCLCYQCDREYTIWFVARGGQSSVSRMVFLPTRGTKHTIHTCMHVMFSVTVFTVVCTTVPLQPLLLHYFTVHKCLNCQGSMAVDYFRSSARLLQHHHCDLPS